MLMVFIRYRHRHVRSGFPATVVRLGRRNHALHSHPTPSNQPLRSRSNGRAYVEMKLGRVDDEIRDREEAVRVEPTNADLHANLARAYSKKDRDGEAMIEFNRALLLNPRLADTHLALSRYSSRNWGVKRTRERHCSMRKCSTRLSWSTRLMLPSAQRKPPSFPR